MTEITYYVADDGTQFEDENECMKYELKQTSNYFVLLSKDKILTTEWSNAWFCYVSPKIKNLDELSTKYIETEGMEIPYEDGYFYWINSEDGDEYDGWINIEEKIDELNKQIRELENIKKLLTSLRKDY